MKLLLKTKHFFITMAALAAVLLVSPALASAHNEHDSNSGDGRRGDRSIELKNNFNSVNEFGVHVLGDRNGRGSGQNSEDSDHNNKRDDRSRDNRKAAFNLFYTGTVTATSDSGFSMTTKNNASLTVNTESAKIIRIPRSVISNGDIRTADTVYVTGTLSGSTITASTVYDKSENIKPAFVKGNVTATSNTTLTVQNKNGSTATVTTDSDTKIMKDGESVTLADIAVGTKVKIFGLWDEVLHVFTALKIKIK